MRHTGMATRMQVLAPLGTFVAVGAVIGIIAAVALAGPGDKGAHSPKVLQLATGASASQTATTDSSSALAAGGDYRLTGTLPAGTPPDAAAWTLGDVDKAQVAGLEKALGARISQSHHSWYFASCAQDAPVSKDGAASSVGCAVATPGVAIAPNSGSGSSSSSGTASSGTASSGSGGTTTRGEPCAGSEAACAALYAGLSSPGTTRPAKPVPCNPCIAPGPPKPIGGIGDGKPLASPPPAIPKATVLTAVTPVFEALGLDVEQAKIDTGPYGGSASLDPAVGGLETSGMTTTVGVDASGTVQFANGYLGDPSKGDSYPLITAEKAFASIPRSPRAYRSDVCRLPADGSSGCVQPPPLEITGAHLGLQLQFLKDDQLTLLPAWLFEVKGSSHPVGAVAVQEQYLATPADTATDDPAPAPPSSSVEPASPSVRIDKAFRGSTPNEVVVEYGDSGSCPWLHVTPSVKEDSSSVYVVLQADPHKNVMACTDDYRAKKVTVKLQAPLGDRTVIDANGGQPVAVS